MAEKKYLYVFDDFTFGQSDTEPTEQDLECIADGTLEVLCISVKDGKPVIEQVQEDSRTCEVNEAGIEDDETGSYHYK